MPWPQCYELYILLCFVKLRANEDGKAEIIKFINVHLYVTSIKRQYKFQCSEMDLGVRRYAQRRDEYTRPRPRRVEIAVNTKYANIRDFSRSVCCIKSSSLLCPARPPVWVDPKCYFYQLQYQKSVSKGCAILISQGTPSFVKTRLSLINLKTANIIKV